MQETLLKFWKQYTAGILKGITEEISEGIELFEAISEWIPDKSAESSVVGIHIKKLLKKNLGRCQPKVE